MKRQVKFKFSIVLLSGGENEIAREQCLITVPASKSIEDAVSETVKDYISEWDLALGDVIRIEEGWTK